jgi:N-acetyl-gamma-glutamylphosphate reductase
MNVHIFGSTGRIGREIVRLNSQHTLVDDSARAEAWVLAVPGSAADSIIDRADGRSVIDMSGALKRSGRGRYGLLQKEGLLQDGSPPAPGDLLANPGCFAGSVIVGMRLANIATPGAVVGPMAVMAVGGATTAHRSQKGGMRLAKRQLDHPHAQEIQAAMPGLELESFALMVAYAQPRGILTILSGALMSETQTVPGVDSLDVAEVVGTPRVLHRLTRVGGRFTLGVALDNLSFPAANAVALLDSLAG